LGLKGTSYQDSGENYKMRRLNYLYSSPNIVREIKLRRVRWAEHVAVSGRVEVYTRFWWGNLKARDHLEDPGIYGMIILKWIFRK
jgi:hypothetical protein